MPALDTLLGSGAIHIADQNRHVPFKTICGLALDKDSTRYLGERPNFDKASCKVCRQTYFGESWDSFTKPQEQKQPDPESQPETVKNPEPVNQEEKEQIPNRLFGALVKPVNDHTPKEPTDGA